MQECHYCGFFETYRYWDDRQPLTGRPTAFAICDHCYEKKTSKALSRGICDKCGESHTLYRVVNKPNTRYCYPCFKVYKYKPPKYTAAQIVGKFL